MRPRTQPSSPYEQPSAGVPKVPVPSPQDGVELPDGFPQAFSVGAFGERAQFALQLLLALAPRPPFASVREVVAESRAERDSQPTGCPGAKRRGARREAARSKVETPAGLCQIHHACLLRVQFQTFRQRPLPYLPQRSFRFLRSAAEQDEIVRVPHHDAPRKLS